MKLSKYDFYSKILRAAEKKLQFSMANKGTFIYLFLLMVFSLLLVIITLFSLLPMMIVYVRSNSLSTTNDDSNFLFPPSPPISLSLSLSHTHTLAHKHMGAGIYSHPWWNTLVFGFVLVPIFLFMAFNEKIPIHVMNFEFALQNW